MNLREKLRSIDGIYYVLVIGVLLFLGAPVRFIWGEKALMDYQLGVVLFSVVLAEISGRLNFLGMFRDFRKLISRS